MNPNAKQEYCYGKYGHRHSCGLRSGHKGFRIKIWPVANTAQPGFIPKVQMLGKVFWLQKNAP